LLIVLALAGDSTMSRFLAIDAVSGNAMKAAPIWRRRS
jgi:hypothetical protein